MSVRCPSRAEEMAEDLKAQEKRAVERYGHTKDPDAEWPTEFAGKFQRWEAQLHEYERLELAEAMQLGVE